MRNTIKVLVVDDSALIRQMLTRALSVDPRVQVVGVARTGVEAVQQARDLDPDVVTLDITMPEMDGLEALPFIVKDTQARVLMLTSLDDPDLAYQALSMGAVDFISKPREGVATSLSELSETLLKKIRTAYRIPPEKRFIAVREVAFRRKRETSERVVSTRQPEKPPEKLVVMASSTGGPPALEAVFSDLSADLPAAFLIVQHLPSGFTPSLTRRLAKATNITVTEGQEGMPIDSGVAYVAPHGVHMAVSAGDPSKPRLRLDKGPPMHGVRPSADPLFMSAAEQLGSRTVGVLLTGMGADGADGIRRIMDNGGYTILQDEESSVVWGMPSAAIKRGVTKRIVPLSVIASEIRRAVRGG